MSHVPVETVEEDAADLQFPKGMSRISNLQQFCYIFGDQKKLSLFFTHSINQR